jgi:arylsulfatase A-like enzyme
MARALALLLTLAVLFVGCNRDRKPVDERADVLLIIVDAARADHYSAYGYAQATSPRLDAFAREAVLFERAYAHSGWTLPSIATIYTGLHPHEHRAVHNGAAERSFGRIDEQTPTLASLFASQGYATGGFVNNTFLEPIFGMGQGFEHYDCVGASNQEHRSAGDTVEAALAWLSELPEERPVFLVIHMMEPHTNYDPPAATRGRFTGDGEPPVEVPFASPETIGALIMGETIPTEEQQRYIRLLYDEEILAADLAFGQLLDGWPKRGRDRWTAFTADHGEEFWDHGGFEHGHSLATELTRVPLVVQAPGWAPAVVSTPVQQTDLFRTLVDVSAAPRPEGTHGEPLLAVIRGEVPARPVLQEDRLYGTVVAGVIHDGYRFDMDLITAEAALWKLDEHGQNGVLVTDRAIWESEGQVRYKMLGEMRGGFDPYPARSVELEGEDEILEQLKSLGYVDR